MASLTEIHQFDFGTYVELTIKDGTTPVDISTADAIQFIFQKKNKGNTLIVTPVFTTDGKDGKARYYFLEGQVDTVGKWSVQAYFKTSAGEWYTSTAEFQVLANLGVGTHA